MFTRRIGKTIILSLVLVCALQAQPAEKTLSLSLEDCILEALKNNLNVAINVLTPQLSEVSVVASREKWLPDLSFSYGYRDTSQASYSFLDAAEQVNTLSNTYSADFTQLLPTGGTLTLSLDGDKTNSNRSFQTINPRYGGTLTFNFSQPLLRNFGFKMNRREIIIAQNNLDISEFDFKNSLQNIIYSVEEAYWNLVYSIENLKVREQSLQLAQDLLEKNRRAVEVGTMAPIDVLSAESTVASRQADIIEARASVRNNEDNLKTLINLSADRGKAGQITIAPTDQPSYESVEVNLDQALALALDNRPDLKSTQMSIKNNELNVSWAKNQMLPNLSLSARYWSPGITGDQILYLNDDAFTGVIVDTITGQPSEAWKDALGFKYSNLSFSLNLSVPLDSFFTRATLAQARINLEQAMLRLKNQEQQIFLEIKNAVRAVETNYQRAQAYRVARELAQRQLEAEEERLKVGLTTPYFVLQYQRDLRNAQIMELRSIMDYNLSLARLQRSTGVILEEKNISVTDVLYK
ncbi:MAG: TolC family protein [Candidatus Aminicenantes bacterium]|jgi:outer membrane protein TolC